MTDGFICGACGFLRDTSIHELGCVPYHETHDRNCLARDFHELEDSKKTCIRCK